MYVWQKYPLVRLALPLVVGMVGANFCISWIDWNISVLFTVLCALAAMLVLVHFVVKDAWHDHLFGLLTIAFSFVLGATLFVHRYVQQEQCVPIENEWIEGVVADEPQEKEKTFAARVRLENGLLLAYLAKDSLHSPALLHRGDRIAFSAQNITPNSPRQHPQDSLSQVFAPYHRSLFFSGIAATCYVPSASWCQQNSAMESSWIDGMTDLRQQIHTVYAEQDFDGDGGALVEALTTGNRAGLSRQIRESYARSGVAHLLALSGYHLTVILLLFNCLIHHFCLLRWRKVLALMLIPLIWAFCIMAGMPPSLVRATTMCTILQVALVAGKEYDMLNATALTAIVMLLWNPLQLMNVGFQLSFISVVGIGVFLPKLFVTNTNRSKMLKFCIDVLTVSLVCSLVSFPLVAYYFGHVPLLSVLTNLALSPLMMVLMLSILAWWVFYGLGLTIPFLSGGITAVAMAMNAVTAWVASLSFATFSYRPSEAEVALLYAILFFIYRYWHTRSARMLQLFLCCIIALCLLA